MSAVEPYASYKDLFNVWTVDAVSNQSGVSGDPSRDVVKDTALGSYFWCDDIERLLCVDTAKVESYAAKAPEADLVVVLGNSTKYGGAGYTLTSQVGYDGIATASSDHADSDQIAVHEPATRSASWPTSTSTRSTAPTPAPSPTRATPPSSPPAR
ncbi:hypothetical protein SANTM175S_07335 [Streptomyces antimycoticus]